jgi:hypothetical protein
VIPRELEDATRALVMDELGKIRGRTETLSFVNQVISQLRSRFDLSDELEAVLRPMVVDILWGLSKEGRILFDDDLLHFTPK